jgi:FG-GAP repeat
MFRVKHHCGRWVAVLACCAGLVLVMLVAGSADGRGPGAVRGVFGTPEATLTGAEPGEENRFGERVAISADGEFALVGAPGLEELGGAAWIFRRSGSRWSQQGPPLTAGARGAGDRFGDGVALSANGEIALVGAPEYDGAAGAVWVFKRFGAKWAQQGPALTTGVQQGAVARSAKALPSRPTENSR